MRITIYTSDSGKKKKKKKSWTQEKSNKFTQPSDDSYLESQAQEIA